MVEGARLESVYTPKVYRGFESLSLRQTNEARQSLGFVVLRGEPSLLERSFILILLSSHQGWLWHNVRGSATQPIPHGFGQKVWVWKI